MCSQNPDRGAQLADETPITPEMIAAGVIVLDGYRPEYDGLKATVSLIYQAMFDSRK